MFSSVSRWANLPDKLSSQLIRFIIIGCITVFLDLTILIILTDFFNVHYLISTATGFIIASCINYILSVKFVFYTGRFKKRSNEIFVFMMVTSLGIILNHIIMYSGHELLLINYKLVKILSLVLVTIFNFLTKKFIVFLK